MERQQLHYFGIAALGLTAILWWSYASSYLTVAIHTWSGSPERPPIGLLWLEIYAPSLALGLLAGALIAWAASTPVKGWTIFCGVVLVGALVAGAISGGMLDSLVALGASIGTWLFLEGSLLPPLITSRLRRAV